MGEAGGWMLVGLASALLVLAAELPAARAADLAYGEYLASECVTCHRGRRRTSVRSACRRPISSTRLRDYRAGRRQNPVMQSVARSLDDGQIVALATYFASIKDGGPGS